jgi:hypothetical protein
MTEFKQFPIQSALAIALLLGVSQSAFSHTRLDIPTVVEGIRIANNVVIGHSCGEGFTTIANSTVFPDGVDSIVKVDGVLSTNVVADFLSNWGNLNQKILDHSVFPNENEKTDANGNVVGFWVEGGKGMPDHYSVFLPFRAGAALFEPESCAASVKVAIAIADICKITDIAGFGEGILNLWTPAVGSDYDGPGLHGYNSPATLTYMRDLAINPLPESCGGTGVAVEVIPSAAQINRDMPIVNSKGKKIWPKGGGHH